MKNLPPGATPSAARLHSHRSPSSRRRRLALGAALALALSCGAGPAFAGAPPVAVDEDPLDLFLDTAAGERALSDPPGGALAFGIEATLHTTSDGRSSFGVMGFLQVPIERLLAPRRRAFASSGPVDASRAVLAEAPASRSRGRGAPAPSAEERPAREETSPPDPAKKPPPAEERAPRDPPAILVTGDVARGAVRAACKAAKLDEADARLDALASRARTSALLPELRLRATRAIDESESLAPTEYDPLRRTATGGTSTWLEARATFKLDRLVFADDEIAVEKLRVERTAERARLVAKVLELLEMWQRARSSEADPDAKSDARLRAAITAATAEASLDVLTDGWFSRAIGAERGRARAAVAPDAAASEQTAAARGCRESPQGASAEPRHDAAHPCAPSAREPQAK